MRCVPLHQLLEHRSNVPNSWEDSVAVHVNSFEMTSKVQDISRFYQSKKAVAGFTPLKSNSPSCEPKGYFVIVVHSAWQEPVESTILEKYVQTNVSIESLFNSSSSKKSGVDLFGSVASGKVKDSSIGFASLLLAS